MPHETVAIAARSVYTIQPCTMSLHAKPHTQGACVFSCNLQPALLAEWPMSFTCCCGKTGVERIPKSESAQKADPGEERIGVGVGLGVHKDHVGSNKFFISLLMWE